MALLSIFDEEIGVRNGKDNNKNIYISTEILSLLRWRRVFIHSVFGIP